MLQGSVLSLAILNAYLCPKVIGWPAGTYGLIKSATGCPDGHVSWHTGTRFWDTENTRNSNKAWPADWNQFLTGSVTSSGITLEFCIKETYASSSVNVNAWPRGSYCILKYENCPSGFSEGNIYWDDQDDGNANTKSGALPDGTYNTNTNMSFCCRNDQAYSTRITLPAEKPFVLLRYGGHCQDVTDMGITHIRIFWDNENINADSTRGFHPDEDGGAHDHQLHFCHYDPMAPVVG